MSSDSIWSAGAELSRRDFLGVGVGGALASLPRLAARSAASTSSDRSLIVVFLDGGLSHIDSFDCKPEAKVDIRGELRSRRCALEGVFVSAELPRVASLLDRCVLVRSLSSGEGNHDRASRFVLTGRRPSPVLEDPSFASAFVTLTRGATSSLPPYLAIPDAVTGGGPGYLGPRCSPFEIGSRVLRPGGKVEVLDVTRGAMRAFDYVEALDSMGTKPRSAAERELALVRGRANSVDRACSPVDSCSTARA